jgi:hypothetical protein
MSHLDTAYQLGVKKAEQDFNTELRKAAGVPGSAVPGAPTVPTPINPQVGGGVHNAQPKPVIPTQIRQPAPVAAR